MRRRHRHRHHGVTAQHCSSGCNLQQLHELLPCAVPAPLRPHFLQSHSICSALSASSTLPTQVTRHTNTRNTSRCAPPPTTTRNNLHHWPR